MATETSVVKVVSIHLTGETAKPTAAAKGANVDLSLWGGTEIGSVDGGHDANLDEDSITMPFMVEDTVVMGPLDQTATDHIMNHNGAGEFEFTCYDQRETLMTLDSDISVTSNVGSASTTRTKRTVVIEINGFCMIYFPKCVVRVSEMTAGAAGDDGVARTKITVKPEATSGLPGGFSIDWFQ